MKKNLISILSVIAALAAGAAGHSVLDPSADPVIYRYDCSQVEAVKDPAPEAVEPDPAPVSE